MHSFVTSKNAQWPRLIWPTLYIYACTVCTEGLLTLSSAVSNILKSVISCTTFVVRLQHTRQKKRYIIFNGELSVSVV